MSGNDNDHMQQDDPNAPAAFSNADKLNLHNTVENLIARLAQAEKAKQANVRVANVVTAHIAEKKQDAVMFLVEKSATICPFTYRELNFPDNVWFGKDVACRVSLFSTKAEINDALLVQNKGFRAEATKFNYIGLAVLFNTARKS